MRGGLLILWRINEGFESQITGQLSPWCGVFTDDELQQYEYANDIRYYYGLGPGTDLEKKMMTPYLNAMVGLLEQGPGTTGTAADGRNFTLPGLLTTFLNDGQLAELVTASGVFDDEPVLSGREVNPNRLFVASHFVSMRGTIAFERLNCLAGNNATSQAALSRRHDSTNTNTNTASTNATYVRIKLNDAVYTLPSCRDGPGGSCLLSDYVRYVSDKYAAEGDWIANCNVTAADAPSVVRGASFYTDLTSPWLRELSPGNVILSNV